MVCVNGKRLFGIFFLIGNLSNAPQVTPQLRYSVQHRLMSASYCKHCEMPLEAMWSSYAACEPGGGSVPSSASLVCAHCPEAQLTQAAGAFLRAWVRKSRIANAFVLLLASCAVAFAASGFQDEVFFSLGGGVLVWILVRPLLTLDRQADRRVPHALLLAYMPPANLCF